MEVGGQGGEREIRITKPYKLASREMHEHDTVIRMPRGTFGEHHFTIIAGPCSVENEETILRTADWLMAHGIRFLRAGAFKPRTSPYAFQGLGHE
jgi:3-deoxy-7-phosphoheptulonate synthase